MGLPQSEEFSEGIIPISEGYYWTLKNENVPKP